MKVVPRQTTRLEADETRDALLLAWPEVDRETAASLLSLLWVETGRGASCQNWNVGNLSASPRYPGDVWRPPWFEMTESSTERDARLHQKMLAKQAPEAFRSYRSLTEGMRDFVRLIRLPQYRPVLEAAQTGEILPFVKALSQKYSADYSPDHWPAFSDCRQVFVPLVSHLPAPKPGLFSPSGEGGLATAALLLALKYLV